MFMRVIVAALAPALISMPVAAQTQARLIEELWVEDIIITSCFENTRDTIDPPCIGAAAEHCQGLPEGKTTLGISECLATEAKVWDRLLNETYRKLQAQIDGTEQSPQDLIDAQRGWMQMRDADCRLAYDEWGGGSMRVIGSAQCRMTRTARRSLELRNMLLTFEGRE